MTFRKQTQTVNHQVGRVGQPIQSTIGDDVKGLLQFAGAGMGIATNFMNEKVQKDAIKQIRLVAQGQMPSSDATQGGYRAAKALGTEIAMERYKARADELAAQDLSDEDFDTELANLQATIGAEIDERFPEMKGDEELDTLRAMAFIDTVPQITYAREANKLKREQAKRGQDFQTWLLGSGSMKDTDFESQWKELSKGLKLSEGKAEELGVSAIVEAGDEALLDKLSRMKDSQGVAFTDKYGEINTALQKAKGERMADELHITSKVKDGVFNDLVSGNKTEAQAMEIIKANRAKYGEGFMTDSQVESMFSKTRALRAEGVRIATLASSKGPVPKKDQPLVINKLMEDTLNSVSRQYSEEQLADPKTQSTIYSQTVNQVATDLNNRNIVNNQWVDDFKSIAAADPNSIIVKNSEGVEILTAQGQKTLNTWKAMPEATKSRYANGERARILNEYDRLTQKGVPEALAIRQAQESERIPKHVSQGVLYETSTRITEELYNHWIATDVPDAQLVGVEREIQQLLNDGFSEESATTILKENSFQLDNGQVVFANPKAVMDVFGVETPDRISQIIGGFKESNKDLIKQRVSYLGGSYEDTYPKIDVNSGTISFYSADGFPISGLTYNLSELRSNFDKGLYNETDEEVDSLDINPKIAGLYIY